MIERKPLEADNQEPRPATGGSVPPGPRWSIGTLSYTRTQLAALFGWLLCGDFAWQLRERAVSTISTLMLKTLGASDTFIGSMMNSVPSALGLIAGPIVNTISDSYRSPRGRRIPFLLVPIPFAVGAMLGLAFTPDLAGMMHRWAGGGPLSLQLCRLGLFAVFWIIFEVSAIVTNGIYNALVNDVVPHSLVGRFFGVFRMVSLGAGIIFFSFMIGHAEVYFKAMLIGLALIYGAGMTVLCLKVKEGSYPPPPAIDHTIKNRYLAASADYFRETFSIPFYRWLYLAIALWAVSGTSITFLMFFAKSLNISLESYGWYTSLTYMISFCASFLWGYLADRFHPLRMAIFGMALNSVSMLLGGFFAHSALPFAIMYIVSGVGAGCFLTVITPLYQLIFPRSRFGAFSSAVGLIGGICTIVFVPLIGAFLDAMNHDYRLICFSGGGFGLLAVAALLVFHGKFMRLGGPQGYVPPE